ncbi:c-type cytochrome domain-containing protein [Magnetofaba australis]|nr:c-type cytochrome domain-containing protein [Magnetofaba australis]
MNVSKYIVRFLGAVGLFLGLTGASMAAGANNMVSYKEDVYPIIQYRCLGCHKAGGAGEMASGLNMETYEGLMKGTKHGAVIMPHNALASTLVRLITGEAAIRMPHNAKRLSSCEISTWKRWILQGAKDN